MRFSNTDRCVLCGRQKTGDLKIIVGLYGSVCSSCVSLCTDILGKGELSQMNTDPVAEVLQRLGFDHKGHDVSSTEVLGNLIALARSLGDFNYGQVIFAEGNTSCRDGETLWIKASGAQMDGIGPDGFVQVDLNKVVQSLDQPRGSDEDLRRLLNEARTDPNANNFPSTETFMHAWLLSLPGVSIVAHTHPVSTLGVMCGPMAREFAENRYFPDQVVLCGPRSPFVPYCAPGFDLAVAIRGACAGSVPKTILLQNHGMIATGKTANEALAACLMMEKAAQVFVAAGKPRPLTPDEVAHIQNWTDEHYRQSKLWNG